MHEFAWRDLQPEDLLQIDISFSEMIEDDLVVQIVAEFTRIQDWIQASRQASNITAPVSRPMPPS